MIQMEETPEIADIPQIEKVSEEKEEEATTAQKIEQQISDSFQTVSRKLKETVNIDLFLPDIQDWILERIKTGTTLIIGDKIGGFAEKIAKWTIENMQDEKGYFYYQKWPFLTNKIAYMRWGQAWMMLALSTLFEKIKK